MILKGDGVTKLRGGQSNFMGDLMGDLTGDRQKNDLEISLLLK